MVSKEAYEKALVVVPHEEDEEAIRAYVAELEESLAVKDEALRMTIDGQVTLMECIADLKGEQEQLAREAWAAARSCCVSIRGGTTTAAGTDGWVETTERYVDFDDWKRKREGK